MTDLTALRREAVERATRVFSNEPGGTCPPWCREAKRGPHLHDVIDASGLLAHIERLEAVVEAGTGMTGQKLRDLATWVDLAFPDDPKPEVQSDLRAWADALDNLNEHQVPEQT